MRLVQYWDWHVGEQGWDEEEVKEMDDWEEGFFEMIGPDNMYDLFIGANYIDARGCLERGAEYVADLIRKMKVDEIREYFGMKNDFSPEEEEQLKKDYPWAYDDDDNEPVKV
ncbi:hypothetical protein LUZ60_017310 [Juncus effusus]|nr:hypothetical protein LUZ60_017310 [Juncus effusus]